MGRNGSISEARRGAARAHARRGHECSLCGRIVFGNGGQVSHGRAHVRRGEAVELEKYYGLGSVGQYVRAFLPVADTDRIAGFLERGYQLV